MIALRYAFDRSPLPAGDHRRVLTSARWPRGLPRGYVHHWYPALAPEPALRMAHFAGTLDPAAYARMYSETLTTPERQAVLAELRLLARDHHLLLLSLRRDLGASHLQVIRRYLLERPSLEPLHG